MEYSISSVCDRFDKLNKDASSVKESMLVLKGKYDMLKSSKEEITKELSDLNEFVDDLKLIEAYLAKFADERQEAVFRQIEETVSEGLLYVFEEDLKLEISTKMVGARSEVVFNIVSTIGEDKLTTSIMDSRGGGVAAIVGFLIQAVLVLMTPGMRKVLFLDETFRAVSEQYQAPLGEFIKSLCDKTGLQVVLVSHQPTISDYADVAYAFSQSNGVTKIKKVV